MVRPLRLPVGRGALVLVLGLAACGGQRGGRRSGSGESFECNDRRAGYTVVNGFVAPEAGVAMTCDGPGPRITTWRVDGGRRIESTHSLTGEQFDDTWVRIDSTGWRFLARRCAGASRRRTDPLYTIDVADAATEVSLSCRAKALRFPYDRLVNELDLRAAGFGDGPGSPG